MSDVRLCHLHNLIPLARALPFPVTLSSLIVDGASTPALPPPLLAYSLPSANRTLFARLEDGSAASTTSHASNLARMVYAPPTHRPGRGGLCGLCEGGARHGPLHVGGGGKGRRTVGIKSLFFTAASCAAASKNRDRHAMLNAIQHGVMIANLQIQRKEQQCELHNIVDQGEVGVESCW